jgi:two-component system, NarL family, response regulator LiaR
MVADAGAATRSVIKVVLADDHALVREGTAELLERAGGIRVVGQAADGHEAVLLVSALRPDVLLLDIAMPGLSGLEVTRRARELSPSTAVVALTAHDEEAYVLAMLDAGASGYLSKASRGQQVVQAVRAAAAGEMIFSRAVAASLKRRALAGPSTVLTPRELEVLRCLAQGLGNKQIASTLGLSARTVQTHLTRIFAKLGVTSRTEAVLYAVRQGWTGPDTSPR